ncbi:hypothetical protein BOTBODRAFT_275080 [Botryobasidium botryosum FD-172 SS1]|uniref:SAM-dependent MTase RsmB/NOP-type domain-containing protein n=1 Tax=Botryobasidium botryosum (strain FD-172 SS1) TaxID=930990 RepID=A0A067MVL5_BOTB1|nr:hypothetical protein BOTBODRAFT_275080 [Botryobasidium botryosum FD-172 SS1]
MNFYKEAASILDRLDAKKDSIKGALSRVNEKDRKRTAALVIETLKYKPVLSSVIADSGLLKAERRTITSPNLALLLIHDLLFARGIQASDGPLKQAILRHKTRLQAELVKIKVKKGVKSNAELAQTEDVRAGQIPRYVRVNTNCWSVEDAIAYFSRQGFTLREDGDELDSKDFSRDLHIPTLLLFSSSVSFQSDKAYQSGKIILQDKASCFPAVVLAPPSGANTHVIDATAAPGNKTTQLSALMGNAGKLFAFERDKNRFKTLQTMVSKAACTNVETANQDFLLADPRDNKYKSVTHISLLDPSCSGSGIVNRLDYLLGAEDEADDVKEERLQKLSAFQLSMIRHAMKFPAVTKIVYSTCSIHAQENEQVVRAALASEEAQSRGFVLAPRSQVIPTWERRGLEDELDDPSCVIRCSPGEDRTNGFFVSCFVVAETLSKTVVKPKDTGKRKVDSIENNEAQETATEPPAASRKKKKRKKTKKSVVTTD